MENYFAGDAGSLCFQAVLKLVECGWDSKENWKLHELQAKEINNVTDVFLDYKR